MLRTFYYINALTGESVETSLRDRNVRLLFLEALHEMWTLFARVMQSNASVRRESSSGQARAPATTTWTPDTIACTYLPIHAVMVLLPLPDALFHLLLRVVDFGLSSSASATSVTAVRRCSPWCCMSRVDWRLTQAYSLSLALPHSVT